MSDNWDFYTATIDQKPASIFLDLGISAEAPKEDSPVRLIVLVRLKDPQENGLTTREEADALWGLEDALVPAVKDWGGVFVGRITHDGRRDFVFYAPSAAGFDVAVSAALVPFGYEFETMDDEDPGWEMYFDFLYPSKWQWQSIMNRRVIENLKQHGDDLSKPRRVFHWLYFSSDADRERCAVSARETGFSTIILEKTEKAARPFGLELHRIDSVLPADIDAVCHELVTLAQDHSGQYDGWETQVVKAGEEPVDDAPAAQDGRRGQVDKGDRRD